MPMINTTSNWLCSGAFRSPPGPNPSVCPRSPPPDR